MMLGRIWENAGTVKVRFLSCLTPDGLMVQQYSEIFKDLKLISPKVTVPRLKKSSLD